MKNVTSLKCLVLLTFKLVGSVLLCFIWEDVIFYAASTWICSKC